MKKTFIENIFKVTREVQVGRETLLAQLICANGNPSLQEIATEVVQSDRTGWKECLGNLCQVTGYSTQCLGLSGRNAEKVHSFGGREVNPDKQKVWEEKLKKINQEYSNARMNLA
jgi:hypothetical protein